MGELERCRAIYDLAIGQGSLDMPETLWKSYIDFEISNGETDRTRALYRALLERTKHVKVPARLETLTNARPACIAPPSPALPAASAATRAHQAVHGRCHVVLDARPIQFRVPLEMHARATQVWISFARFEAEVSADSAAEIYREGELVLKESGLREERAMLLEAWAEMEEQTADQARIHAVKARMPTRIKKKRPMESEDGQQVGWEEYYDYVFPDEQTKAPSLKILEMAHKWKKQKLEPAEPEG